MATPTSPDFNRYLRIRNKIAAKNTDLTTADYEFFANFSQEVDQTAINKYLDTAEFKKLSPEEQTAISNEAALSSNLLLLQQPEYKQQMLDLARKSEQGKLSRGLDAALKVALAGFNAASSIGQIRQGDQAAEDLVQPGRPAQLTADPALKAALRDAQEGDYGAARALAPAQLAILDSYLSDLNRAQTVSGGQSGVYGALGQVASTSRARRGLELAPIGDEIRRAGQSRYDNLLGQKLQENRAIQESQSRFYPLDVEQYNAEAGAAGELGSAGRLNLRTALGSLGNNLPQVIADMSTRRRFGDIYNQAIAYGEKNARTMAEADMKMRRPDVASAPAYNRDQYIEQLYELGPR